MLTGSGKTYTLGNFLFCFISSVNDSNKNYQSADNKVSNMYSCLNSNAKLFNLYLEM